MAILLLSTLGACSTAGMEGASSFGADAGSDKADDLGSVSLEVDQPAPSTYWSAVPVTGHGPANGTLIFTTSGGGQFTEELGSTGDFCIDVPLQQDTNNTIKFEAVSPRGDYSDPILVDILQEGEPPDSEPSPDPEPGYSNIAANAQVSDMTVKVEDGALSALGDGDTSGFVSIRNAATNIDWMVIELNERLPIEQIHIQTTTDCPMERYNIMLSDDSQSGDPLAYDPVIGAYFPGAGWSLVGSVSNGSSDETIIPSVGGPLAQRLAIEFKSRDCGPPFIGTGRHRITEIEVWAQGDEQPGEPGGTGGAPSCTNGF